MCIHGALGALRVVWRAETEPDTDMVLQEHLLELCCCCTGLSMCIHGALGALRVVWRAEVEPDTDMVLREHLFAAQGCGCACGVLTELKEFSQGYINGNCGLQSGLAALSCNWF